MHLKLHLVTCYISSIMQSRLHLWTWLHFKHDAILHFKIFNSIKLFFNFFPRILLQATSFLPYGAILGHDFGSDCLLPDKDSFITASDIKTILLMEPQHTSGCELWSLYLEPYLETELLFSQIRAMSVTVTFLAETGQGRGLPDSIFPKENALN